MRLELITSHVSGVRSNQLSYVTKCTENRIRTDKCLLTRQVLCQLSHPGNCCTDEEIRTPICGFGDRHSTIEIRPCVLYPKRYNFLYSIRFIPNEV